MRIIRLGVCLAGMWMLSSGFTADDSQFACITQTTKCGTETCPSATECPGTSEPDCHVCASQCTAQKCIACNETLTEHPCDDEM